MPACQPRTRNKPYSSSIIAALFPADWAERKDWIELAPQGMRSAWIRRLSWRKCDRRLDEFATFLEQHGQETDLAPKNWDNNFQRLLTYCANQHLLFLLIHSRADCFEEFVASAVPETLRTRFLGWKMSWEADKAATASVNDLALSSLVSNRFIYRGISLTQTLTYPMLQALIRED